MMNRLAKIAGRTLRCSADVRNSFRVGNLYPAPYLNVRYSTKASELINALPKFWVAKLRSNFSWVDFDNKGYITENDVVGYENEMNKLIPHASKKQKDRLTANRKVVWDEVFGGKGKGPDFKITFDMYIERWFYFTNQERSEYILRSEWENCFSALDLNNDGIISKSEHQLFFHSWRDPIGAIVSFTAIDEDMDGVISRDEFTKAGTEFYFNFTDETKPSKHMFGPLRY